jgi:hypothetical protein
MPENNDVEYVIRPTTSAVFAVILGIGSFSEERYPLDSISVSFETILSDDLYQEYFTEYNIDRNQLLKKKPKI